MTHVLGPGHSDSKEMGVDSFWLFWSCNRESILFLQRMDSQDSLLRIDLHHWIGRYLQGCTKIVQVAWNMCFSLNFSLSFASPCKSNLISWLFPGIDSRTVILLTNNNRYRGNRFAFFGYWPSPSTYKPPTHYLKSAINPPCALPPFQLLKGWSTRQPPDKSSEK